jgi:CBS domain containing-hemolysin-like protein
MIEGFLFLVILVLVFCSSFFSSSEAALFSLSETKVRAYHHSKDPKKRLIATLLKRPQELLVTIFVLNTVVNILIQNSVSGFIGEEGSWIGKIFIPFVILLFFGEIFPKQIGLEKNSAISKLTAKPLSILHHFFLPLFKLIVAFANSISKVLFGFLKKGEDIGPEEIQHVLKKSEEMGVLHPDEAFLASGLLELRDAQVREIMRTKEEIIAYDIDEPLTKLTHLFVDRECTRVPVYEKSLDQVLGIITAKNFFAYSNQIMSKNDLLNHLNKPLFCPETTQAKVLLKQFDAKGDVFALVVDEYGSITGLITKEDLIEVVIGSVLDRRDEAIYYTRVNENTIIAKGQTDIEEIEKLFTIGGWLI